jgi:hypothetical protein
MNTRSLAGCALLLALLPAGALAQTETLPNAKSVPMVRLVAGEGEDVESLVHALRETTTQRWGDGVVALDIQRVDAGTRAPRVELLFPPGMAAGAVEHHRIELPFLGELDALERDLIEARDAYAGPGPWGLPVLLEVGAEAGEAELWIVLELVTASLGDIERPLAAAPGPRSRPVVNSAGQWEPPPLVLEGGPVVAPFADEDGVVERPIIILEEEVEVTEEVPRGLNLDNLSNRNLDSTSVQDAYGVGGGAAGAYGQRYGIGGEQGETYGRRFGQDRAGDRGYTEETEAAVTAALRWLSVHQEADGRWSAPDTEFGVGRTAVALLAFLGHGETHTYGPFRRGVRRALNWLKRQQAAGGAFSADPLEHILATLALSEGYALTMDFTLRRYVEHALTHAAGLEVDPHLAAWRAQALLAAQMARLEIDEALLADDLARLSDARAQGDLAGTPEFLGLPADSDGTGLAGLAVLASRLAGQDGAFPLSLVDAAPQAHPLGLFGTTYAVYQLDEAADWRSYDRALREDLPLTQVEDSADDASEPGASWDPPTGSQDRALTTALHALTLEVYYRHERGQ